MSQLLDDLLYQAVREHARKRDAAIADYCRETGLAVKEVEMVTVTDTSGDLLEMTTTFVDPRQFE